MLYQVHPICAGPVACAQVETLVCDADSREINCRKLFVVNGGTPNNLFNRVPTETQSGLVDDLH